MTTRTGQRDLFTKRVRGAPAASEFSLHVMIADVLARWRTPGWRSTHMPLGEYRPIATAGKLKRMGVTPGWPDFILLSPDKGAHFLELKRHGEKLSEEQREFEDYCETHHYPHAVVDCFDDAVLVLKTWGALRITVTT
jgi:hypothetical protein